MTMLPSDADTESATLPSLSQQGIFVRPIDMHPIGRRVAGKRVERGLTQRQLATLSGLSHHTVVMIEGGDKGGITYAAMIAIAEALQVSLDYLTYGAERPAWTFRREE